MQGEWAYGIDIDRPTPARMYDYYLGGAHNFAADRAAAEAVLTQMPQLPAMAQANRAWLRRVVRDLAGRGIDQYIDIGSGIPTMGNVHEVAQHANPHARVVYVDIDPVAVMHSRRLLAGNDRATSILGDLRRPGELLDQLAQPGLRAVIDPARPTALLLLQVLPFVPGEEAYGMVSQLLAAQAPGSYLAITHMTGGVVDQGRVAQAQNIYRNTAAIRTGVRSREQIGRFFDGLELVEPGLVWVPQWWPDDTDLFQDDPQSCAMLCAVGRRD